jgi:hypothetical protein
MGTSQRSGLRICLAVLAFILVQAAGVAALAVVGAPRAPEERIAQGLYVLGVATVCVCFLGSALWKGKPGARWFGFGSLVLFGGLLIWWAYWQTTWDFPNASSPEERAWMQQRCRRAWPWVSAWGAGNLVAGALLLLPPVGRFLRAQREKSRDTEGAATGSAGARRAP